MLRKIPNMKKLIAAIILALPLSGFGVGLSWDAADGAAKYYIYEVNATGGISRIGESTTNSFTLTPDPNAAHAYVVTAVSENGVESPASNSAFIPIQPVPPTPQNLKPVQSVQPVPPPPHQ